MMRHAAVLALAGIALTTPLARWAATEASNICINTQTSGSGPTRFETCVTDTGNVRKFVTPAGVDSLVAGGDSYTICDAASSRGEPLANARAWSRWGSVEFNFMYPTTRTPTANVRTTADGRYTLTQSFRRDAAQRQLIVTMTLKNNGPGAVTGVWLQRAADMNAGGSVRHDLFVPLSDSVIAVDIFTDQRPGMMMSVLTPEIPHNTFISTYNDFHTFYHSRCMNYWEEHQVVTGPDDYVGMISFDLGTLQAGQSKTVKIVYQRV